MNTNSNSYTLIYATVMVVIVALTLAFVSGALKDTQNKNVKVDKKKQILSSLLIDTKDQDAEALYTKYITTALTINSNAEIISDNKDEAFDIDVNKELAKKLEERKLPIYVANVDGKVKYIIPLRGTGLWGPIWGYIALNEDKSTIFGANFSHASETPGLGAEISLPAFQSEFIGKSILNDKNEFVSIAVMKAGQTTDKQDQIDGISGGTITSKGVEKMLLNCIGQYEKYLKTIDGGAKK